MGANDYDYEDDWFYGNWEGLDDSCPACGNWYDEIDFEYQMCSICGFDNN